MKTTFKIAKSELSTLFYSPIAWFLALVFLVQCAMTYTGIIAQIFTVQDLGGEYSSSLKGLTFRIFGSFGLSQQMMSRAYLYLPLLTMGLISRELSSGTIKLFYSSPVKVSQIIMGKFMAMLSYNMVLLSILGIFLVTSIFNIEHADIGLLLSCLLGVYLLLCTYAAIGLFMSSLTSYQVVAAVSTLVIFAALDYIGTLWQDKDGLRDLTYFFSLNRHTGYMLAGLVRSTDILYFCLIIVMFLVFGIIKLQAEREYKSSVIIAARYLTVVAVCLAIGYITSRPALSLYLDTTANKDLTLTPNSQKLIRQLGNEPLEITSYINLLDNNFWLGMPSERNQDLTRWEKYLRFKPDLKLKYVYYWDTPSRDQQISKIYPGQSLEQIARHFAKSMRVEYKDFKTPSEISRIIDLKPEQNRYVMQLKYKGKTTWLRLYDDLLHFPSEQETDAAIERLLVSVPKIAFLEGEAERSKDKYTDKDYTRVTNLPTSRYSLVNQGFDVTGLSLQNQDIPKDIAALVIADPRISFSPQVLAKLQAYIRNGGNLMITGEPGKQAILNPLLALIGVKITDGILVQKSSKNAPDLIGALFTREALRFDKRILAGLTDSTRVGMPGTAGLSYDKTGPFSVIPLLATDPKVTWNKKGPFSIDSLEIKYSAKDGDQIGSFPTALALTRQINGKQQRIFVSGDADFLSNGVIGKFAGNSFLSTDVFGWFSNGQFPFNTTRPKTADNRLNLTEGGVARLKIICIWVLPALLSIFGAVFLIRRQRK